MADLFVLTGAFGPKSWPAARPMRALPRAITVRQDKAARRLASKGGAVYLKTFGSRASKRGGSHVAAN